MNKNTTIKPAPERIDKSQFKNQERIKLCTAYTDTPSGEPSTDLDEEDQHITSLVLTAAKNHIGIAKTRARKMEPCQEIISLTRNIKRLRRILRTKKGPRPLGFGKLRRINKAVTASGTRLPPYEDTPLWYATVGKVLREDQKRLTETRERKRKEDIRTAVDRLLLSQQRNPKEFYRAANADKLTPHQELSSVYATVEGKLLRTNAPDIVKSQVQSFWQNIFNKRAIDQVQNLPWLQNTQYDQHWANNVARESTPAEFDNMIHSLANGKIC